jgi:TatA/E family protein of Tat protein translocase
MDFFGIGPFEVLLVLLIAFIIFGPKRLLEMSKKAGKVIGDLTRSVSDLNETVNEELKEKKPPMAVDANKSDHIDGKERD